jgi:SAM-dependent methyltransferase
MTERILREHRETWDQKPVLRAIYTDFYDRIVAAFKPGLSLEIGGGTGNLKDFTKLVVSTDIIPMPWLDAVADAQALPFKTASFTNVVAVDVLHHIERPKRFLKEAQRVLQPGGRIILLEPAITPVSWIFYHFLHPEPVIMSADPLEEGPVNPNREPFDANQAFSTLLFGRYRRNMNELFPDLKVLRVEWLSFFAYPLSGGFRPWCLIPSAFVVPLLTIERRFAGALGRLMAFRHLVVIEKSFLSFE